MPNSSVESNPLGNSTLNRYQPYLAKPSERQFGTNCVVSPLQSIWPDKLPTGRYGLGRKRYGLFDTTDTKTQRQRQCSTLAQTCVQRARYAQRRSKSQGTQYPHRSKISGWGNAKITVANFSQQFKLPVKALKLPTVRRKVLAIFAFALGLFA